MKTGYFPIKAAQMRQPKWHLFRRLVSLCGMHEVASLPNDELEPEPVPSAGRTYCKSCQRILDMEKRKGWPAEPALSQADKEFIIQHWQTHTAKEITQLLGRTLSERVEMWGGHYCPTKTINTGRFTKGQVPATAKPELDELVRLDNRKVPYWFVRGGKYGWQHKHVVLWEAANGPVPEGKVVVFKDGDTLNCVVENLELITRSAHLGRNSGREELTDKYVSSQLARTGGAQGQFIDRELQQELLQVPELLEVKRNQMRLNRAVKTASES